MLETLRVARVLHATAAEGPGLRTAIWFQGCSIRCRGCINPHLFSPRGGYDSAPDTIVEAAVEHGVEGLTLVGGEPFDQPAAGASLARAAQMAGLGVITFSGYLHEDLVTRPEAQGLLNGTDLLIDGPYRMNDPEERRALVGSSNQRFIHLTDRYVGYDPDSENNRIELRVGPDGLIEVAGFLDQKGLSALASRLGTSRRWRRQTAEGSSNEKS